MAERRRFYSKLLTTGILGLYIFISFVACVVESGGDDANEGEPGDGICSQGEPLSIVSDLPPDENGEVDEVYTFTFIYDSNTVPADRSMPEEVKFTWSFGDGANSGSKVMPLNGRYVTHTVTNSYAEEGRYGLVVSALDGSDDFQLGRADLIVNIGDPEELFEELEVCEEWQVGDGGGYGVTVIEWDVSAVPARAKLDLAFEAYDNPDRFIIEYPIGTEVLDTGWRGAQSYTDENLFPGGIISPGHDEIENIFVKGSADKFRMTVIGPGAGTAWEYAVRCRVD